MKYERFDVIGIGLGPSNLSAAILFEPLDSIKTQFYEAKEYFSWHPGLLFPNATLTSPYLKDLVTLANPRSEYTFTNYLFVKKRIYQFLIANFSAVTRIEFNDYFRWVSECLSNVQFGKRVLAVDFHDHEFYVRFEDGGAAAHHLILGSGHVPNVPPCAQQYLGKQVFHASEFGLLDPVCRGLRVAVVGGGQTGAEVVQQLLKDRRALPKQLTWITRRSGFLPVDESAFTNEIYIPAYGEYFYNLPPDRQNDLLQKQKQASYGIKVEVLQDIYRQLYHLDYLDGKPMTHCLLPGHNLIDLKPHNGAWQLVTQSDEGQDRITEADLVILCTGYKVTLPDYLAPLQEKIMWVNNNFVVARDYSIEWSGPPTNRIYIQSMASHVRGVQDANFVLAPWRNMKIVNSIVGKDIYDTEEHSTTVNWEDLGAFQNLEASSHR